MPAKPVASWSDDEVAIWLHCIGLGDKVDPFKVNAVDGSLLLTLEKEDLTGDLGLTGLQAKKVLQELEFTKSLSGGGGVGELSEDMEKLQLNNKKLEEQIAAKDAKIAQLERELAALKGPAHAPAPAYYAPAPAPPRHAPPPKGAPVVREAAKGTAQGAVKGAIGKCFTSLVPNARRC